MYFVIIRGLTMTMHQVLLTPSDSRKHHLTL